MILWSYSDPMRDYTNYYPTKAGAMDEFERSGNVGEVERYVVRSDLPPKELACVLLSNEGWVEKHSTVIHVEEAFEPQEENW